MSPLLPLFRALLRDRPARRKRAWPLVLEELEPRLVPSSVPLALSGFNQDMIYAKGEASAKLGTTTTFDGVNVLYEAGAGTLPAANGLPTTGNITSAANPAVSFNLASYTGDNVLFLNASSPSKGTLTLNTPGQFSGLHILDSAANAVPGTNYQVTLTFTDGSTATVKGLLAVDWLQGSRYGQQAITNLGRVARSSGNLYYGSASLYEVDVAVPAADQSKNLQSLTFQVTSGANLAIFAVSADPATIGPPSSVTVSAGSGQIATVNTAFATNLAAIVTDANGNPVPNVTVTFTAPSSGASGAFTGGGNTITEVTNSSGVATASTLTANFTASSFAVSAAVSGVGTPANFSETNNPGPAKNETLLSGNNQSGTVGTALANPLVVQITDQFGNPVSGTTVNWAAATGGGSVNAAISTTNSSGDASINATIGTTAGSNTFTATVSGLTGSPVTFTATGTAGPAKNETLLSGNNQSGTVGTALANPLVVQITDQFGNPVSGTTVNWAAATGGGSVSAVTSTSNSSGDASINATLGTTAGSNTFTATVSGLTGSPVAFSAAGTAATPARITLSAGSGQSATVNTAFTTNLAVTVKDAYGNLVPNVTVTFTAPGSGASGAFTGGTNITQVTNSSGVATASTFTADSTAGSYTVSAVVTGVSTLASFSETNNPGAPASITLSAGSGQSSTVNTLTAIVTDSNGNPVPGVTVTFTASGSGASGAFAGGTNIITELTNSSGVATVSTFTTGGPYTVSAAVSGVSTPASFILNNSPGSITNAQLDSTAASAFIDLAGAGRAIAPALITTVAAAMSGGTGSSNVFTSTMQTLSAAAPAQSTTGSPSNQNGNASASEGNDGSAAAANSQTASAGASTSPGADAAGEGGQPASAVNASQSSQEGEGDGGGAVSAFLSAAQASINQKLGVIMAGSASTAGPGGGGMAGVSASVFSGSGSVLLAGAELENDMLFGGSLFVDRNLFREAVLDDFDSEVGRSARKAAVDEAFANQDMLEQGILWLVLAVTASEVTANLSGKEKDEPAQ